jgi:hypothetical protein
MADEENHVLVTGLSPVTRKSGGRVVGFPDVCRTPSPGGPVPIPYPNSAESKALEKGSRTVSINGAPVCLSSSRLGTSTGDEAGTAGGGVSSGRTGGAAHPVNYSFDVRIEGKPVVRNLDLFTLNDRNTAPFPIMQPQVARPVAGRADEKTRGDEKCPYCGKERHEFARGRMGNHLGNSLRLRANILEGRRLEDHPWYAGRWSIAAHHLICSEAMDNEDWAGFCRQGGYDIDRKQNGVMLPMRLALACQLFVAVHRGPHDDGWAYDLHLPYPKAVKAKLRRIRAMLERGAFCEDPTALVRALDALSAEILVKVAAGEWTLTSDGLDYLEGGVGGAGVVSLQGKSGQPCPHGRRHNRTHAVTGLLLTRRALRTGE